MGAPPLIPDQRHQLLLQLLRNDGVKSTRQLTDALGVSHMTVRRDIAALEAAGLVLSVKGGVRLAGSAAQEPPRARQARSDLEMPRKQAIATIAETLIEEGMVVFLDAGTTCQAVAGRLTGRRDLTVVTNDFYVVTSLLERPEIQTIHTGGVVDTSSGSSSGRLAAKTVGAINIDLCLLSTGAWSVARGVTSPALDKVELKQEVMSRSSECVLVADSTKYGSFTTYAVTPLADLDIVITDDGLPEKTRQSIGELDVDLRVAAVEPS